MRYISLVDLVLIACEIAPVRIIAGVLSSGACRVELCPAAEMPGRVAAAGVALVFLDDAQGEVARAIRALPGRAARVPMISVGQARADVFDDAMADATMAAMVAAHWMPVAFPVLDRLADTFGMDQIVRLATGLRALLLAAPDGDDAIAAHRIAGMAGMLGFAALGSAWADGTTTRRCETRRAVVALDRFLRGAACPACAPASGGAAPAGAPPPTR